MAASGNMYLWNKPAADIVVSDMEVYFQDGKYFVIPETRFNSQSCGNPIDFDGWEFRYLYIDTNGVIHNSTAGTSGGLDEYPPDPPAGSIRSSYLFYGFGTEEPDGHLNSVTGI